MPPRDSRILEEVQRRRRAVRTVGALLLLALPIILWLDHRGFSGVWFLGVVVMLAVLVFLWYNSRCPGCNRHLGKYPWLNKVCPGCGAQLQE